MKKWNVEIPIAGVALIEVEADSAESAINEALDAISQEHIESWDGHRRLVQGNVCHAPLVEAHAEEITDDE